MLKFELRAALSIFPGEIPRRITQPCDSDAPALITHVEYVDLLFGPPGSIARGLLLELPLTATYPHFGRHAPEDLSSLICTYLIALLKGWPCLLTLNFH